MFTRNRFLAAVASVFSSLFVLQAAGAPAVSASVMSTPGKFEVDDSGGATYSIPLRVPPGPAGMQPALSLAYNARSGNGLLGVGWSIAGLSAITRCAATFESDTFYGPADYGSLDRFCLDGQRLVLESGTHQQSGAEYRTERESFVKVVAQGPSQGYGPSSFKAWTKSGLYMEFGATADSQILAKGRQTVRVYAVNRIEDTAGNVMTFDYYDEDQTNGQYYPKSISYAGGRVEFLYEARADATIGYSYGSSVITYSRMTGVRTYTGATGSVPVLHYQLGYDATATATGRSRIVSIRECDGAGVLCHAPISLAWTNIDVSASSWPYETNPGGMNGTFATAGYGSYFADFNADGFPDVLWANQRDDGTIIGATHIYVWHGGLAGSFTLATTPGMPNALDGYMPHIADFNGDGRPDILWDRKLGDGRSWDNAPRVMWWAKADGTFQVQNNIQPTSGRLNQFKAHIGEFNGDGLADILWLFSKPDGRVEDFEGARQELWTSNGNGTFSENRYVVPAGAHRYNFTMAYVADFNGDGLSDVFWDYKRQDGRTEDWANGQNVRDLWFNKGQGVFDRVLNYAPTYGRLQDYMPRIVDLNSDGTSDILWDYAHADGRSAGTKPREVWIIRGSNTSGYWRITNPGGWDGSYNEFMPHFADFNADGLVDVIWNKEDAYGRTSGTRDLWLGNGWGSFTLKIQNFGPNTGWAMTPMDLNGDGLMDLFWDYVDSKGRSTGSRAEWLNNAKAGKIVPDLVERFTDSLGVEQKVNYALLTNPAVYTKETTSTYPFVDLKGPMVVAGSTEVSNGIGGKNLTTYTYKGARAHLWGRGFVGFRELLVKSDAVETTTKYEQTDRRFHGMVLETEARRSSDQRRLKIVTNTFGSVPATVPAIGASIHFIHTKTSGEVAYDLGTGAATYAVTTTQTYDDHGNPTQIVVATSDGFTKTTNNQYTNDETKWHLGRLTRAEVIAAAPGVPQLSRVSTFAYEAARGFLEKEVRPDGLATDYVNDSAGNKASATTGSRGGTTAYDTLGRFPVTRTNALGHQEELLHGDAFGELLEHRDVNGFWTRWEYDSLGRKKKETRPDGTKTTWSYEACGGSTSCAPRAKYLVRTQKDFAPEVVVHFDALNREVRTASRGFDPNQTILRDTEYDSLGRVSRATRNYFAGSTPQYTVFAYDILGRVVSETAPGESPATTVYEGMWTRVTVKPDGSAPAQTTSRRRNSQDQIVEVVDASSQVTAYGYDAFGNLVETVDAHGNVTAIEYSSTGLKTKMTDPDMGTWEYTYNPYGELETQKDAKGQVTTLAYDALGRMVSRTEEERSDQGALLATWQSTWEYDTAPHGKGKLFKSVSPPANYLAGSPPVTREYAYESVAGRPSSVKTTIENEPYTMGTTYDPVSGLVDTVTYPATSHLPGFAVKYAYTAQGYLDQVRNASTSLVYWDAESIDADGNVTFETLGNGVQTMRVFNPQNGALEGISSAAGASTVQSLGYVWDDLGNLRQRQDNHPSRDYVEEFQYDSLNRLIQTKLTRNGVVEPLTTYEYDEIGNLTRKSDVGTYDYAGSTPGVRPHAVKATSTSGGGTDYDSAYLYDANGNMQQGAGRTVLYTPFNNVREAYRSGTQVEFGYDADRTLALKVDRQGGTEIARTHIVGAAFERVFKGALVEDRHYVSAGGVGVAIEVARSDASTETRYLHREHLGSLDAVTNAQGAIVESLSYDPHGRRRDQQWISLPLGSYVSAVSTDRGFTGHQHVDGLGLIHMNGRVYEPILGRFLTPDSNVQEPYAPQALNRYSYVLNNPLSFTDPTGFFFNKIGKWFKKHWRLVAGVAATVVVAVVAPYGLGAVAPAIFGTSGSLTLAGSITVGAMAGAAGGAVATGSLQGAALGALSGAVFGGIGSMIQDPITGIAAHALAGGGLEELRGGQFLAGFLAAGFTKVANVGGLNDIDVDSDFAEALAKGAAGAVVGGTGAIIGGGKFANGAVTGAFAYAFGRAAQAIKEARQAGTIYVTGHRVGEAGPYHLALEYAEGGDPTVLSAGAEDGLLVSRVNRSSDAPALNVTIGEVRPPAGMSAGAYFNRLQQADLRYCDCVDYDLFPGVMNGYNSNSYVRGLINATGGATSVNFDRYFGGPKPLPPQYFGGP